MMNIYKELKKFEISDEIHLKHLHRHFIIIAFFASSIRTHTHTPATLSNPCVVRLFFLASVDGNKKSRDAKYTFTLKYTQFTHTGQWRQCITLIQNSLYGWSDGLIIIIIITIAIIIRSSWTFFFRFVSFQSISFTVAHPIFSSSFAHILLLLIPGNTEGISLN